MSFYSIVLFLHITGALGLFAGIGLEWMILYHFKKITVTANAYEWSGSFSILRVVFSYSGILILLSGIYMTIIIKNITAWIITGFILYLFLAAFGSIVMAKKIGLVIKALPAEGEKLSEKILKQIQNPLLHQSLKVRTSLALGIIFLMTVKPGWPVTIATVLVSLIIGFSLIVFNRK